MLSDTLPELKREAKQLGIPWQDVVAAKQELLALEQEQRAERDALRERAWQLFCTYNRRTPGCWTFWRCGFDHVRRRLSNRGQDHTAIRRYDEIFTTIACEYPEWQARSSEGFWQAMFDDYQPWPSRELFYFQALELMTNTRSLSCPSSVSCPPF